MLTIGITGSSGSGKGYVCDILRENGIPCLDTDRVCHDLYKAGTECSEALAREFGAEILTPDGIDRKKLGAIVFSAEDKLARLNEIAHFYIRKETVDWLGNEEKNGTRVAVIDAPLLFESGFDALCDIKVTVTADRETQISRITERDGISAEAAEARLSNQKPTFFYVEKSDYVIDNSASVGDGVKTETKKLADMLLKMA